MGVSTPIPSKRKHVQYIMGVGSPIPSHEAELFSYMPYVIGVAMANGQFAKRVPACQL